LETAAACSYRRPARHPAARGPRDSGSHTRGRRRASCPSPWRGRSSRVPAGRRTIGNEAHGRTMRAIRKDSSARARAARGARRAMSAKRETSGSCWRGCRSGGALPDLVDARLVLPRLEADRETPQLAHMREHLRRRVGQRTPAVAMVAQRQRPVAVAIEAHDLHVRNANLLRMLLREQLAHALVTALVVDAVDDEIVLFRMICDREQMELADEPR